jgi:predicted Fe-Mo cluster-binding NifX family protein
MIIAFATNDKIHLYDGHFGDAKTYSLYEINQDEIKFLKVIENTVDDEVFHGPGHSHGGKAKLILNLFKEDQVSVVLNKAFGTNITKIRQKILPIVSRIDSIEIAKNVIQKHYVVIEKVIKENQGSFMILNTNKEITMVENKS